MINDKNILIIIYQLKNQKDGKVSFFCENLSTEFVFFRGGFRLIPHTIEFYQGQSNRLSDRIQFRRILSESDKNTPIDPTVTHQGTNGWVYECLSP